MYIKRHLEKEILKASKNYPVVMVCGARQVGKSTMLNHIKEDRFKDNRNDSVYIRNSGKHNIVFVVGWFDGRDFFCSFFDTVRRRRTA